jgi:hypothetical protein
LQKSSSRRPWLIPALIAAILFIGGVASNLIASDLEKNLKPYRHWVFQHAEESLMIFEQIEDPRATNVRAKLGAWRVGQK